MAAELFSPPLPPDAPPEYAEFWRLWQGGEFFACHEVLEELWRRTAEPQRLFYNGLIHAAVAIYQHRRGNAVGAARQWVRAQAKLAPFAPRFCSVEVTALLRALEDEIAPSLERLTQEQAQHLEALRRELHRRFCDSQFSDSQRT